MSTPDMASFEDRRWSGQGQVAAFRHRAALELIRDRPVLDVGAGDGLLLRMLRDAGVDDARGLDLSSVAVDRARASGLVVERWEASSPLPFEEGSFGTVVALDVLEHLAEPEALLREIARVGRTVVIAVPNFSHWRDRMQAAAGRVPFQCRPGRGHIYWFTEAILIRMARQLGLRPEVVLREAGTRLGRSGRVLADLRPSLFAVSVAVRFAHL